MKRGGLAGSSSDAQSESDMAKKCRNMATENESDTTGDMYSDGGASTSTLAVNELPKREDALMKNTDLTEEHLDAFENLVADSVDSKPDDYEPLPFLDNPVVFSRHRGNREPLGLGSLSSGEATAQSRTVSRSSCSSTDHEDKSCSFQNICSSCTTSGLQEVKGMNMNANSTHLEEESFIKDSIQRGFGAGIIRPMPEESAFTSVASTLEEGSPTYPDPSIRMGAYYSSTRFGMDMMHGRGYGRRNSTSAMDHAVRKAYEHLELSVIREILLDDDNTVSGQRDSNFMMSNLHCPTSENNETTDWRSIQNPPLEYIQRFFGINPRTGGQEGKASKDNSC